jgi:hypothetical protein
MEFSVCCFKVVLGKENAHHLENIRNGPFIELSTRPRLTRHGGEPSHGIVRMSLALRSLTFKHAKYISCFHRNVALRHEVNDLIEARDVLRKSGIQNTMRHSPLYILYTYSVSQNYVNT